MVAYGMSATAPTLDDVIRDLRALVPELKARGVTRLAIFGSRARGDNRPDSDLDVLIEVAEEAGFSAVSLVKLERQLSEWLGVQTHIAMPQTDDVFHNRIRGDLIEIA